MARVVATRYIQVGGKRTPVKRIKGVMQLLPRAVMEATAVQLRVSAEETRELVIDKILAGSGRRRAPRPDRISKSKIETSDRKPFKLKPLSPNYARGKELRNEDGRILVATGDYIAGIEVRKANIPGSGVVYGVGLENRNHVPSGIPLAKLAKILERGSAAAKIPPRPHWAPTRRIVLRKLKESAIDIQADALRRLLRAAR